MSNFTPSKYQAAIFDWIDNGTGNAIVGAVAGSGKTTTLSQAMIRSRSRGVYLAFNKEIVESFKSRLEGTGFTAQTFHSLGNAALGRHLGKTKVEFNKAKDLARTYIDGANVDRDIRYPMQMALVKLFEKVRLTLTEANDTAALLALADKFDITLYDSERDYDFAPVVLPGVAKLLQQSEAMARQVKSIDFADMIYLPVKWGLTPVETNAGEFVFVDEVQDLNAAQRKFLLSCIGKGRVLAVGDPRQAIYAFAGADSDSFMLTKAALNAIEMPLSICYRCPTSVLDLARQIVPEVEARDGAPVGEVIYAKTDELGKLVQSGDLILCRITAPLVRECIALIKQKINAQVRGRSIGKELTDVLRKLEKDVRDFDYAKLGEYLENYRRAQVSYMVSRDASEQQVESLHDKVDTLHACAENFQAVTLNGLCEMIESLFSDSGAAIWFSTIHRAKGLEADRVFILEPSKLPLVWKDQTPAQFEQEMNLYYVALTRAKNTLIVLGDLSPFDQTPPQLALPEPKPVCNLPDVWEVADYEWGSAPFKAYVRESQPTKQSFEPQISQLNESSQPVTAPLPQTHHISDDKEMWMKYARACDMLNDFVAHAPPKEFWGAGAWAEYRQLTEEIKRLEKVLMPDFDDDEIDIKAEEGNHKPIQVAQGTVDRIEEVSVSSAPDPIEAVKTLLATMTIQQRNAVRQVLQTSYALDALAPRFSTAIPRYDTSEVKA